MGVTSNISNNFFSLSLSLSERIFSKRNGVLPKNIFSSSFYTTLVLEQGASSSSFFTYSCVLRGCVFLLFYFLSHKYDREPLLPELVRLISPEWNLILHPKEDINFFILHVLLRTEADEYARLSSNR